jgi:hypothetical protein
VDGAETVGWRPRREHALWGAGCGGDTFWIHKVWFGCVWLRQVRIVALGMVGVSKSVTGNPPLQHKPFMGREQGIAEGPFEAELRDGAISSVGAEHHCTNVPDGQG